MIYFLLLMEPSIQLDSEAEAPFNFVPYAHWLPFQQAIIRTRISLDWSHVAQTYWFYVWSTFLLSWPYLWQDLHNWGIWLWRQVGIGRFLLHLVRLTNSGNALRVSSLSAVDLVQRCVNQTGRQTRYCPCPCQTKGFLWGTPTWMPGVVEDFSSFC